MDTGFILTHTLEQGSHGNRNGKHHTNHQEQGGTAACELSARFLLMLTQPTVSEQGMVLPTFRGG